jgi:hypothetical protein
MYGDWATQYPITLNGSGNTIDGLNVSYSSFGFDIGSSGTGCTIKNLTGYGYSPYRDWPLFRSNATGTLFDNLVVIYTGSNANGKGIKGLASSGGTVSNCVISGGWYWGIEFLAGTWAVSGCTISGCTEDGISTYAATGSCSLTVYNNTVFDNHHGGCTFGGVANITFHHNTVYMQDAGDADLYLVVLHNQGTVNAYHNVLAYGTRAGSGGQGQGFYLAPISGTLTFGAQNNAFYSCYCGIDNVSGSISYGTIDYNGFYGCTNNFSDIPGGNQGTHNVTADPGFTAPASYDFSVSASSPYYNAGVAIAGINDGYSGAAPEIGRFEVQISSATLTATLAGSTLSAAATVAVRATVNRPLAGSTLSATARAALRAALTATLQGTTLTATALSAAPASGVAQLSATLEGTTLIATAAEAVRGSAAVTLAGSTLAASARVGVRGSLTASLAGSSLQASAVVLSGPGLVLAVTLEGSTLVATATVAGAGFVYTTPAERTLFVPAEGRTLAVKAENRTVNL